MKRINIHEAKTHLSRVLRRLKPGQPVLICRCNVPIAELRAIPKPSRAARPFGLAKGLFEVPDELSMHRLPTARSMPGTGAEGAAPTMRSRAEFRRRPEVT